MEFRLFKGSYILIMKRNLFYYLILLSCGVFFLFNYSSNNYIPIDEHQVDKWRILLNPVSFTGQVENIIMTENKNKYSKNIIIKLSSIINFSDSENCKVFRVENDELILAADNLNISTGPYHRIESGDIITKTQNSDTIWIYKKLDCCKFFFPIFDGLGTSRVQMQITAQPICN